MLAPAFFFTLKYAIEEIEKHRNEICRRVGLDEESFNYILSSIILPELRLVEITNQHIIEKAKQISMRFDPDDYPFIALALELDAVIWTNDKAIIKCSLITNQFLAVDTQSLEYLLKGKDIDYIKNELKKKYLSNPPTK